LLQYTETMKELWQEDRKIAQDRGLIGVDEAGRGCLAGPVVAGAVYLNPSFFRYSWKELQLPPITDSKKLSLPARQRAFSALRQMKIAGSLHFATGFADVEEIDRLNILGATRLAMERAIREIIATHKIPGLSKQHSDNQTELFARNAAPEKAHRGPLLLVDGRPMSPFPYQHQALVGGDGRSLAIAMASIVAKVTRDQWMDDAALDYPCYQWEKNKGYGTRNHRLRIMEEGKSPLHRRLFLRKIESIICNSLTKK